MKNFTLSIAMLLFSVMTFAQAPVCPTSFKRNNGNGGGCGSGKITFNYSVCPNPALVIDSILVAGVKSTVTVGPGTCSNGSVSYCFTGGNLATASVLDVYFSGPGISSYSCTVQGGPLPIKISSFYTKRNVNNVTLTWKSESEINAKEFIIERNTGNGFVTVGTVAALNNEAGASYSFVDNNNSKKVSEYRLKLVDLDATFKLSETRAVKGTAAVSDFTVFPNPSNGYAKISIADVTEATTVEVIDNAGRVIKTIALKNSNTVEVNGLQNGIYLVRITNKNTGDAVTKKLSVSN